MWIIVILDYHDHEAIKTRGSVSVAKRDTRRTVCYLQEAESS